MALIIKADMPTCCKKCDLRETVYGTHLWYRCFVDFHEVTQQVNAGTKSEDCPILGEIPDDHGRLVAVDELEKAAEKMVVCDSYEYTIAHEMVKKLLKIAPTVLEAVHDIQRSKYWGQNRGKAKSLRNRLFNFNLHFLCEEEGLPREKAEHKALQFQDIVSRWLLI